MSDATQEPTGNEPTDPTGGGRVTGPEDLDRVLDVRVELTVELGKRKVRIAEVLDLGPGSVIEFPKAAEDPLDILVNDQLIARGEAVVIGERYGVRITEVVSPNQRLQTSGVIKEVP
jgi:flagellar motor switch protein FliN/FliY